MERPLIFLFKVNIGDDYLEEMCCEEPAAPSCVSGEEPEDLGGFEERAVSESTFKPDTRQWHAIIHILTFHALLYPFSTRPMVLVNSYKASEVLISSDNNCD